MNAYQISKIIGATLLISGICIGSGMLAIPIVTSMYGLPMSIGLITIVGLLMLLSSFLIIDINISVKKKGVTSFNHMAKETLGVYGQLFTIFIFLTLTYSLISSYTSQTTYFLENITSKVPLLNHMSTWELSLIIILFISITILKGKSVTIVINNIFIYFKFMLFFLIVLNLAKHININYFSRVNHDFSIYMCLPILLPAFGYHVIIPTISRYFEFNSKYIRLSVILGGFIIPVIIYTIWIFLVLGTLPLGGQYGLESLKHHGNEIGNLMSDYRHLYGLDSLYIFMSYFMKITIITSFIGVSISLFNFNQDLYNLKENYTSKVLTLIITFIPPYIFTIIYPNGFLLGLSLAAIFMSLFNFTIPALMAFKASTRINIFNQAYGKLYLTFFCLIGVALFFIAIIKI